MAGVCVCVCPCVYMCATTIIPPSTSVFLFLHRKAFSSLYPEVEKNRALKKSRKEITSVFQKGGVRKVGGGGERSVRNMRE